MNDKDFEKLASTFGFAPSRALRELLDAATAQAALDEREACATFLERVVDLSHLNTRRVWQKYTADLLANCAAAIRARSNT